MLGRRVSDKARKQRCGQGVEVSGKEINGREREAAKT